MFTKHFFKVLGTFLCMIILGMMGLFLIDHFSGMEKTVTEVQAPRTDCKIKNTC